MAWRAVVLAVVAGGLMMASGQAHGGGPVIEPPFTGDYTAAVLGAVPGLPSSHAGVAFLAGDPNTLLIGGRGNEATAEIFSISVVRDTGGHITGFTGQAQPFADAPYIDGGLVYYNGVLFYSRYQPGIIEIGQIKPGSTTTDKVSDLSGTDISESPGGLNVVPPGHPGAGQMKLTTYEPGDWHGLHLEPDGNGTYNVTGATDPGVQIADGVENFVFPPLASPQFANPSVLINEYNDGLVAAYEVDANGDPILATRRPFLTGLNGPDGAVFDPITGDLLLSDYEDDLIIRVTGFPAGVKGDTNCDGTVDAFDALVAFTAEAGADTGQPDGCPEIGSSAQTQAALPAGGPAGVFGDVDCDSDADLDDALVILRYVAELPLGIPEACAPPGSPLTPG